MAKVYLAEKEEVNKIAADLTLLEKKIDGIPAGGESAPSFLRGLKYYAIGDSIVEYQGTTAAPRTFTGKDLQNIQHTGETVLGYIQDIENKYGLVCSNFGLGGHTIVGDYGMLAAKDYSDVALVTIAYGVNDARTGIPLGTVNSVDTNTFAGCLNLLLKKIYTDNPECRVIVLSPIQRLRVTDFGIADANTNGNYLIDFVNMCRKVAEKRSTYFIDMYRNSGLNQQTLYYYTREGVHPLNTGYRRMSALILAMLSDITSVEYEPFGTMTNVGDTEPDAPDDGGNEEETPPSVDTVVYVDIPEFTKTGQCYDGWGLQARWTNMRAIETPLELTPNVQYVFETVVDTEARIGINNRADGSSGKYISQLASAQYEAIGTLADNTKKIRYTFVPDSNYKYLWVCCHKDHLEEAKLSYQS